MWPSSVPPLSSLRLKVLLSLALAGLALMLTLGAVVPRVIVSRFDRQEARRMRGDTLRVAGALRAEVGALSTYVVNWSSWDDTYRYVGRPTRAYEASNLVGPSFESAHLNLMLFLNARGEVVSARAYDLGRHRWLPAAPLAAEVLGTWGAWLRPRGSQDAPAGVAGLRSGAWLLAARPILTSEGRGPAAGTLIMGRQLTPVLRSELKRDADLTLMVQAVPAGAPRGEAGPVRVVAPDERHLRGLVTLRDLAGRPTLGLTVGAGRDDHANGLLAARALLLAVLAVVLLFTALSTVLVDRLALDRLSRYRRHVRHLLGEEGGPPGARPAVARFPVTGHDELSDLGRALNELLAQNGRARRDLEHQATHDGLTGLLNRVAWKRELSVRLGRGEALVVTLVDLDNFKAINDTLGHEVGDEVLCGVAARFGGALPAGGVLARLGGDEFVVLLPGSPAAAAAGRLLATLEAPVPTSAGNLFVRASAGVSVWPGGPVAGDRPPALLQHADLAMYRAKAGGGGLQVYRPEFSHEADERSDLERGLRQALAGGELWLAYQPVVDLASGRTLGCEALVRWRSPGRGEVSPARFIPVAEERGLIGELGRWVLGEACAQAAAWARAGAPVRVAVNVSAVQLQQGDFARDVAATLCQTGLPAASLELEVTETAVTRDLPRALEQLARVRALGVSVALDDFGTGYASLELVRELPLDKLKLDRSFVTGAEHGGSQQVIVASVIRMARDLNLQVVAEGVETAAQRDLLSALACPLAQGYLYARPLPAPEFLAHLRGARNRTA